MTYQLTTLPNGLRVVSECLANVESVAVALAVDVGARYEREPQHGIAHLLEHMAFKGTNTRSALQIAEAFDNIGGQFNAYTSLEHTVYYTKVLKGDLPLAVEIIGDILQHSVFDAEELAREQGVICQEIAMHEDAPDELIFDLFDDVAYPNQAFGRSILGTPEGIRGYTRADIITYMQEHYHPSRMVLSAAGNVSHDALVRLAERFFSMPADNRSRPAPEAARYQGGDKRKSKKLEQLQLAVGLPAYSIHDTRYHAAQIFSNVLGGGMSSRLFQEVREKRGLAYHVSSSFSAYRDTGVLTMYAATAPEQAAELPLLMADEVTRLLDTLLPNEMQRAKNQARAELLMSRENPSSVAGWMARHLLIHGRYIEYPELVARIDAVTMEDIRSAGEGMLTQGAPTMAALGPIKELAEYEAVKKRLIN